MNIGQLIASSAQIESRTTKGEQRYSQENALNKPFGQVLQYNKTVLYKPSFSIVEVGMYIRAKTQKGVSGHFAQVAIKGVDMEEKDQSEVFKYLRQHKKALKDFSDQDLHDYINKGGNVYYGKIVMQSRNNVNKYLVMNKNVPLDAEIRVRCSCASYFWDCAWYNAKAGCHIGAAPPAYPKFRLPDYDGPKRNIHQVPGACKHIMLLLSMLMKDGFLAGGTDEFDKGISRKVSYISAKTQNQQRISSMRAKYYVQEIQKQARAQIKAINAIDNDKTFKNIKTTSPDSVIKGKNELAKYLNSLKPPKVKKQGYKTPTNKTRKKRRK